MTRIEVLIVIAIVAVLVAMLLPALTGAKSKYAPIDCPSRLKQVGLAFRLWALDHGDKFPMQVSVTNGGAMESAEAGRVWPIFSVMSNELSTPKILVCTEDKVRYEQQATTFERPSPGKTNSVRLKNDNAVSYFVGLDGQGSHPQMFLAGDRNLEIDGVSAKPGIVNLTTNKVLTWTKTIHRHHGNVALVDGSVQQLDGRGLNEGLANARSPTNRLAIP